MPAHRPGHGAVRTAGTLSHVSERPSRIVIVAAVIEAAQGLAALAGGLYVGWETLVGRPADPVSAIGVTVLALMGGAGMCAVARGLLRRERWSRSPAVLTQLFALPVSWSLLQSDQFGYGLPLAAGAVIALVLLLSAPAARALAETES